MEKKTIFNDFELYMAQVRERNVEPLEEHGGLDVFNYQDEIINTNIEYFRDCYRDGLSPYKALTFLFL